MKKIILAILISLISFSAYSQSCTNGTATTRSKVTKVCYDTVSIASYLNTVTMDTVTATKITVIGPISASNLSGTNTGDQTTVSGSAGSLSPGAQINGTNFTGSSNITITAAPSGSAGGDLSGTYPSPSVNSTVVKSVILNTPNVLYSTPINFSTSSNTATGTLSLNTQSANTIFCGPTTGAASTPAFRGLVLNDIPSGVGLTGNPLSQFSSTTSPQLASVLSDETGTGNVVFSTSPSLTTPSIGAATATSVNKVTITQPSTSATLTLANGSTLATSGGNSITLTSTGSTNITLPTTGTLMTRESIVTNPILFYDFLTTGNPAPYTSGAISSGTSAANNTNAGANTLGIGRITSSTTTNSGMFFQTSQTSIVIKGSEVFRSAMAVVTFTNSTIRLGFTDTRTSADCTNGIYFEITSSAAVLKTSNASTRTTSSTVATLSANTFYKFEIIVNSNATSVTGNIYDVTGASLLGTQTISTNIPTSGTGSGVIATSSNSSATDICDIDYLLNTFYSITR